MPEPVAILRRRSTQDSLSESSEQSSLSEHSSGLRAMLCAEHGVEAPSSAPKVPAFPRRLLAQGFPSYMAARRTRGAHRLIHKAPRTNRITLVLVLVLVVLMVLMVFYLSAKRSGISQGLTTHHVHLFHEPGCTGESLSLQQGVDLCGLGYSSGISIKDNVASVLLAGDPIEGTEFVLDVYGTCRIADNPADPMLLETIAAPGCTDLKFPIAGNIDMRLRRASSMQKTAAPFQSSPASSQSWVDAEREASELEHALKTAAMEGWSEL